jgi:hypothetical protein
MKLMIQLVLLVALTLSFTQKQPEIKQIEFSKIARGYEEHVRIDGDSVNVFIHDMRGEKAAVNFGRKINEKEWVALMLSISNLKLGDVESLASPTMKRAADAAMHGTLTFTDKLDKSYAHGFDDENPHDSLKPILKKVREISGRKETK